MIIAGSETTATLLSGLTYLLLMNPEKLCKLTDEIRSTFETEDKINITSVAKLKYLFACIEEALRMYPPVPVGLPRMIGADGSTISGHFVPPDVSTVVSIFRHH